jgi:hypothetical protein
MYHGLYDDEYPDHEYEEGTLRTCEQCGRERICAFEPNAYGAEIHDDHTKFWLCGGCQYENMMDI